MDTPSLVARAYEAFRADAADPPPLTLRGANAVDSYERPVPFEAAADAPTDHYLELFAFWGLAHLDARSWRHYLPRLIEYACGHPDDPRMVGEALVGSTRPPDRYPPRLGSLNARQEAVVRTFLECVAFEDVLPHAREDAMQALQEWWLPDATSRPTPADVAAARAAPVVSRLIVRDVYELEVPQSLSGSGVKTIEQEWRRVETWGGFLCGDAHTVIAINVTPLERRSLEASVRARAGLFLPTPSRRAIAVPGSRRAERLDGVAEISNPAEPQSLTVICAVAGPELVTLTIRSWPRDDLVRAIERIIRSLAIRAP
jgi:hypothetical protein